MDVFMLPLITWIRWLPLINRAYRCKAYSEGKVVLFGIGMMMKLYLTLYTCLAVFTDLALAECKDRQMKVNCDKWRDSGYCLRSSRYYRYVSRSCRKTCLLCYNVESLQPGCGKRVISQTKRIIGGSVAQPGDWPWIVTYDSKHNTGVKGHYCGGTLISDEWILTAAHCFLKGQNVTDYWLKLGEHHLKENSGHEQSIEIAEIILHPKFDKKTFDNDVALIRLSRKAVLNNKVRTACLPNDGIDFKEGTKCYVAGWGYLTEYRPGPQLLHQATVPLVDKLWCTFVYPHDEITDSMLCAGYENGGIDACKGDSGGPLMCKSTNDKWYLWGVVSWGEGCGRQIKYGVYASTKVLRTWINEVIFLQPKNT